MYIDDEDGKNVLLFKEYLIRIKSIDLEAKNQLVYLTEELAGDIDFLYSIYECLILKKGEDRDKTGRFAYVYAAPISSMAIDDYVLNINNEDLLKIITAAIDIFEKIYPTGTIVELKKEYFKDKLPIDKLNSLKVVINYRFLKTKDNKNYYVYSASVYPNAFIFDKTLINFTPRAIKKVIFKGYSDEQERAYILYKKNELIIENDMRSVVFNNAMV